MRAFYPRSVAVGKAKNLALAAAMRKPLVILNAMLREALGAVNHGESVHEQPPVPSARHLAHYLPFDSRCNCHRTYFGPAPAGAFAFELGDRGDQLELAENMDGDRHFAWEFDRAQQRLLPLREAAPAVRPADYKAWIVDTITRAVSANCRCTVRRASRSSAPLRQTTLYPRSSRYVVSIRCVGMNSVNMRTFSAGSASSRSSR